MVAVFYLFDAYTKVPQYREYFFISLPGIVMNTGDGKIMIACGKNRKEGKLGIVSFDRIVTCFILLITRNVNGQIIFEGSLDAIGFQHLQSKINIASGFKGRKDVNGGILLQKRQCEQQSTDKL